MWHEARRSERKVHDLMDAARRRSQRRAVFLAKRRGDPHQLLQVAGSRCRVHRDDGLYQATEDQQGLIPWNGKHDVLIDRFDGRALLDFIRDSSSRPFRIQGKTEEEEELEEFVNFERCRDLIKHRRRGLTDDGGLQHVYHELEAKAAASYALERYTIVIPHLSPPSSGAFARSTEVRFLTDKWKSGYGAAEAITTRCPGGAPDGYGDRREDPLHQEGKPKAELWELITQMSLLFINLRELPASKGSYSQVGFSYKEDDNEESNALESDEEDDDDEKDFSSDDSNDEGMETIAKEFGIKRYNWLVYMDKKAKEEEKRQKEVIRGDPAIKKLSRKERRKVSQMEREREREASHTVGRALYHDPYRESRRSPTYEAYRRSRRSRSKSRSYSPSYSRRHDRSVHSDNGHRSKSKSSKSSRIEYITEFGGSTDTDDKKLEGFSPPPSPLQPALSNRPSNDHILEALHVDPASALSVENDKSIKVLKPSVSTSLATAKLSKAGIGGSLKSQPGEKKETPQERLKRIMSKQLNKQIKKDSVAEMAKKREQERQKKENLAETSRSGHGYRHHSHSRSRSRSPPRRRRHSRNHSRSRSPRSYYSQSRS